MSNVINNITKNDTTYAVQDARVDSLKEIFYIEYGTTQWADIVSHYNAGDTLKLKRTLMGAVFNYDLYTYTGAQFVFIGLNEGTSYDGGMIKKITVQLNGSSTFYNESYTYIQNMLEAGSNITISRNPETNKDTISATGTTYTAGANVSINNNVISATDTTYSEATTSAAGLESAADKTKLDGIAAGATAVSVSASGTATDEVQYITVNGVEKKLAGGGSGSSYTAGSGIDITNHVISNTHKNISFSEFDQSLSHELHVSALDINNNDIYLVYSVYQGEDTGSNWYINFDSNQVSGDKTVWDKTAGIFSCYENAEAETPVFEIGNVYSASDFESGFITPSFVYQETTVPRTSWTEEISVIEQEEHVGDEPLPRTNYLKYTQDGTTYAWGGWLDEDTANDIYAKSEEPMIKGDISIYTSESGSLPNININGNYGSAGQALGVVTDEESGNIKLGWINAGGGASYTAGANIQINNNVISATDTTYTAGTGISIVDGVISCTFANGNEVAY